MEIVIKLLEEEYKSVLRSIDMFKANNWRGVAVWDAIRDGIVLPERHGRLIEVSSDLERKLLEYWKETGIDELPIENATRVIDEAPTIIEADTEEKMKWDITKVIEEIVTQCKETEEEFIFETIRPYCENILQLKINKEELNRILLRGARPKGKWLDDCGGVKCSCCGYYIDDYYYCKNYCTNCGADLRDDTDEEQNLDESN